MSLLWVKLANHGNKSMVSSGLGYLPRYFSRKVALRDISFQYLSGIAKT